MSKFLVAAVLLSLINHGADLAAAWDDKDFFSYCPPTNCSKHGPEIRFPFRLKSSNTSSACGASCMELACSGQDTILAHPVLGRWKVTAIDYSLPTFKIIPLVDSSSPCLLLQKLISRSIPVDVAFAEPQGHCDLYFRSYATLVCCSKEFAPSIDDADSIAGPISCLGNATHFLYLVDASEPISILPSDCKVCSDGVVPIPMNYNRPSPVKSIISFAEITLRWYETDSDSAGKARLWCPFCEQQGRHCAFSSQRNQTFCMPHGIASK